MTIDIAPGEDSTAAAAQNTAPASEPVVRYDEPVDAVPGPAPAETAQFVYAIGRIEARFPSLGVEKEFAQATGRADSAGLTDRETAQAVLSDPANRYLARQLCWVLTIEGIDTYILIPHDAPDLDLLIDAIRPAPSPLDIDVVIGTLGPLAAPDVCNGLVAPMVAFDQIYSFDTEGFLAAIPRPEGVAAKEFKQASEDIFRQICQIADNSGATDEHRALNYLTVRYPKIYERAAEQFAGSSSLTAVEVIPSRLSGVRRIVNAVFTYTERSSGVQEKFAVKVDVTEEFPFLVAPLSPFYDR
jgi:hypothetical protein